MIRCSIVRIAVLGVLGFSTACASFSQAQEEPSVVSTEPAPARTVVALGRLTPRGEVIKISVTNAEDSRVNQILVQEGDWVEAGQVIAVLQGIERRQRDLEEALKTVEYFQAKLAQIKAGTAKEAEISAQEANISRLEAQLRHESIEREAAIASAAAEFRQAEQTFQRNVSLAEAGAISRDELGKVREDLETAEAMLTQRQAQLDNTVQTLQQQIAQERENLARLQEVRPVDIRVAQAELERAQIAVEQQKATLDDTQVRAPLSGQILRINTRVGEQVNTQQGIVELGQTDQMYAIAEVYETEIPKIQLGQQATMISEYGGFEGEVKGVADHIGLQIGKRTLTEDSANPAIDENTRVVEVKIRINPENSNQVSKLTNMQVRVEIDIHSASNE